MPQELFSAIRHHSLTDVTALLARGTDPNAIETQWPGWQPLHAAINELEEGGGLDVILALLDYGADINGWDINRDVTPLLLAIFNDQKQVIEMLLKAGADPNVRNAEGDSPLRVVVEQGDQHTASLLLNAGATDTINEWGGLRGYTALGLAAELLDISMIEILIGAGADREALDEDNRTASERLPERSVANAEAWDSAMARLKGPKS